MSDHETCKRLYIYGAGPQDKTVVVYYKSCIHICETPNVSSVFSALLGLKKDARDACATTGREEDLKSRVRIGQQDELIKLAGPAVYAADCTLAG